MCPVSGLILPTWVAIASVVVAVAIGLSVMLRVAANCSILDTGMDGCARGLSYGDARIWKTLAGVVAHVEGLGGRDGVVSGI